MKNFNKDFTEVRNADFERIKRELNMHRKDSNNKGKINNEFYKGAYAIRNNNFFLNNKVASFNNDIRELKDLYYEMKSKIETPFFGYKNINYIPNYNPNIDNGLLKYLNESNLNSTNKNVSNDIVEKITKLQNENLELLKHLNSIQNSVDFNRNQLLNSNRNIGMNQMVQKFNNPNIVKNNNAKSTSQTENNVSKNMILKTLADISNKFQVQQSKLEYYQKALDDFEKNENN